MMIVSHIDRKFAGKVRRFDLLADPPLTGMAAAAARLAKFEAEMTGRLPEIPQILIEAAGLNLSYLAVTAQTGKLSYGDTCLVLACGLACGDPARMEECHRLVAEELKRRPFGELVPLAIDVISAAFAGAVATIKQAKS